MNVYQYLTKNTTWFKTGSGQQRIEAIMAHIRQPIIVSTVQTHQAIHTWSFGVLMISWISFGLIAISLYCVFRYKRRKSLQKHSGMFLLINRRIEKDTIDKHPFQRKMTLVFLPSGNDIDQNFIDQYYSANWNCKKIDSLERLFLFVIANSV